MTASTRPRARRSRDQLVIGVVLALSLYVLGLQAAVLRPFLWPAGAGLALSAGSIFGQFAEVRPLMTIRPPDLRALAGTQVTVTRVWSGGAAEQHGLHEGLRVDAVSGADGQTIDLSAGLPTDPAALLRIWRAVYDVDPRSQVTMTVRSDKPEGLSPPESPGLSPQKATVTLPRSSITTIDADGRSIWIRQHLGPIAQLTAFLAGATVLFALGARGVTASLMMLALIATGVANSGPLLGAERAVPLLAPIALIFNWIVTPLAFPVIGIAVLCFPHRAAILDEQRWIVPAVCGLALPMFMANFSSALFLLGVDSVLPLLSWLAARPWVFDASFAAALAANLLIVAEGIQRYRANQDPNERRRIQIVVFTGVPAMLAYAVKAGVPLITGLAGQTVTLPWPIEAALQAVVLLPAIGLSYAVAVRHVFSPRTVLRQSLQYALARKTLTVLVLLPILALVISLIQQRDRPLATIISGQPMFYLVGLGLAGLGFRYRERAEAWLDLHFFREEYDAREILVSLAGRVPYETDPRDLVALVIQQIDSALHPECVAVLAGESSADSIPSPAPGSGPGMLEPVAASRVTAIPLRLDTALVTLLRWSDKPLEVFLDDEESPVARLPQADRVWLTATKAQLLVPIFAGGSDPRPFVGLIVLGRKRSEEPYTTEDRQLLSGIATQMGIALDLSRLRKRAAESGPAINVVSSEATTQAAAGGAHGLAIGSVVDNKYRVEEIVGQGGMGAVFRAWDVRLERSVAIKVVRAELLSAPESRVRFRRESMMVARLQHPAIVTVFDYGSLRDGSAFLVMEYVPGEDLRRLMKREGPLEIARVTSLLSGIAGGVEAAHKAGIFHRDLKPENILLPESGIGPKVVDFGVAKMTDSTVAGTTTLTAGGTVVGTPAYMAPEQLRGSAVDGRADVFSLGVMTYEMLTGRLPFGSGSFIDIAMKQSESQASLDTTGLSSPVAGVLRCAMAVEREARPQSPMVLADELARAAATQA